jgi:hypothetical protein
VLFGILFGERKASDRGRDKASDKASDDKERHAYNWYLNWDDLTKIVFFDPMKGMTQVDSPTLSHYALLVMS